MAFMQPEVLDKEEWAEVETNNGTYWVPFSILNSHETESARRGDFEPLLQYTEGTQVYNDQSRVKKGYGVRLSAPGYMDATDWEVYSSKKEALKRARELKRESEGEDYATKKKSLSTRHATTKLKNVQRPKRSREKDIVAAYVRTYTDSGQTKAYIEWDDGSFTEGEPNNAHMTALFERAKREGVRVRHEVW